MKIKLTAAMLALACSTTFAGTRMEILNAKCGTVSEMMAVMLQQQNKPFSVGGQGEEAFDGPGLAVYAFKQVGLDVPADMVKLSKTGKVISKSAKMLPGDLVFFFNPQNKKEISRMGVVQSVNPDGTFTFYYVDKEKGVVILSSLTDGFNGFFLQGNRITTDDYLKGVKADYQKEVANIDKAKANVDKAKQNLTKAEEALKEAEKTVNDLESDFTKNNAAPITIK